MSFDYLGTMESCLNMHYQLVKPQAAVNLEFELHPVHLHQLKHYYENVPSIYRV